MTKQQRVSPVMASAPTASDTKKNAMLMFVANFALLVWSVWEYVNSQSTTWLALVIFNLAWLAMNVWQYRHHLQLF